MITAEPSQTGLHDIAAKGTIETPAATLSEGNLQVTASSERHQPQQLDAFNHKICRMKRKLTAIGVHRYKR